MAKHPVTDGLSVPALIERLQEPSPAVRLHAAAALAALGPRAWAAVPVLIETLKDANAPVANMAALALGTVGPEARAAIPALSELLNAGHKHARRVLVALGEMEVEADTLRYPGETSNNPSGAVVWALRQIVLKSGRARAA